jgi:ribosomal protein L18E
LRDLSGVVGDRLFERSVIVAALFFSRQAAKPPRG